MVPSRGVTLGRRHGARGERLDVVGLVAVMCLLVVFILLNARGGGGG
jgi:hypothetical protein